jgi:hypothetical protein
VIERRTKTHIAQTTASQNTAQADVVVDKQQTELEAGARLFLLLLLLLLLLMMMIMVMKNLSGKVASKVS